MSANLRRPRFPLRVILQLHAIAMRKLLGHHETRRCAACARTRGRDCQDQRSASSGLIPNPQSLIPGRLLLLFLARRRQPEPLRPPSSSFLPFLMTSGSAGAAAAPAAAASAGAGASSTFGMMTCSSIISGSLSAFHFGLVAMSFTRMLWPTMSSLTSTSMWFGMSAGRHSISIWRWTMSSTPPCCLTPFGSPCAHDRHLDADAACPSRRDRSRRAAARA